MMKPRRILPQSPALAHLGDQVPDARPGHYYVSAIDGGRKALLAGPFDAHKAALDRVEQVRELAYEIDPRSWFYAFGTCRVPLGVAAPVGALNGRLGLPTSRSVP